MKGGQIGLGVLGAVLAFGVGGPIAAVLVAWVLMSPDPAAATARGGGAGAARAAVAAGGSYLADEWRAGGPARRQRRSERRDRWFGAGGWRRRALGVEHALIICGRALRSAVVVIGRAIAVIPAGARAGARAAIDEYRTRQGDPGTQEPDAEPESEPEPGSSVDAGPPEDDETAPPKPREPNPRDSGDHPVTGQAPPEPTGDEMGENDTTANVGSGELVTTGDLRAEVVLIQGLIEQAEVLGALLSTWQAALPENYEAGVAAGGPSTRALHDAVREVAEAGGDVQALSGALNAVRRACDQADSLGEQAEAMGAEGHTKSYANA